MVRILFSVQSWLWNLRALNKHKIFRSKTLHFCYLSITYAKDSQSFWPVSICLVMVNIVSLHKIASFIQTGLTGYFIFKLNLWSHDSSNEKENSGKWIKTKQNKKQRNKKKNKQTKNKTKQKQKQKQNKADKQNKTKQNKKQKQKQNKTKQKKCETCPKFLSGLTE